MYLQRVRVKLRWKDADGILNKSKKNRKIKFIYEYHLLKPASYPELSEDGEEGAPYRSQTGCGQGEQLRLCQLAQVGT